MWKGRWSERNVFQLHCVLNELVGVRVHTRGPGPGKGPNPSPQAPAVASHPQSPGSSLGRRC